MSDWPVPEGAGPVARTVFLENMDEMSLRGHTWIRHIEATDEGDVRCDYSTTRHSMGPISEFRQSGILTPTRWD